VIGKMPHHYYIGLDQTRFHQCVRENLRTRQTLGLKEAQLELNTRGISCNNRITLGNQMEPAHFIFYNFGRITQQHILTSFNNSNIGIL